jgi:hypothetical protein
VPWLTLEVDRYAAIDNKEPLGKTSRNLNLMPRDWFLQTMPPVARSASGSPVSKILIHGAESQGLSLSILIFNIWSSSTTGIAEHDAAKDAMKTNKVKVFTVGIADNEFWTEA